MKGPLLLEGANVWQGSKVGFVKQDLAFENEQITARPSKDHTSFEVTGKWIIPGLIDNHFHAYASSMNGMENERSPLSFAALNGAQRLGAALRRGFTTVRDVAGGDIGLSLAIDEGLFPSPRYFFTGPALSQTGGHGDPRSEHVDVCFELGHMCEIVDGVDEVRRAVRNRLRTGAHAIKVMTSGGVFSLTDPLPVPQYSDDELRAITDEAHRRGTYVTAHSYSVESVRHSIANGVTCIEHGNLIDRSTAEEMARADVSLVPTLATYQAMHGRGADLGLNPISLEKNRQVLSKGQEAIQFALQAGVRVGFGTDLMGGLEDQQLAGIRLQVEAIGVVDAINSMTTANAEIIGDGRLGHLGEGAWGDALILNANPLEEPDVLWEEDGRAFVVHNGHVVA